MIITPLGHHSAAQSHERDKKSPQNNDAIIISGAELVEGRRTRWSRLGVLFWLVGDFFPIVVDVAYFVRGHGPRVKNQIETPGRDWSVLIIVGCVYGKLRNRRRLFNNGVGRPSALVDRDC